ncbi:MAG: gliding motility-associated C-terminal domain-containing protein, partial [Bacteroidota bacterium]|nr:gliding motility-associated C-terminal domain-containing protein [Bacteroidota bacterium]MDX5505982.1 gliding motility-associated C-terminal domain-containing protein [Bacteroidota bacterium]
ANLTDPMPIMGSDLNGWTNFWKCETGIYFAPSGDPRAGKLIFRRSDENQPYEIASNSNSWSSKKWYHIAVVIHPSEGMRMYVDGVQQSDTDPTTFRAFRPAEGPGGPLLLGAWSSADPYQLSGTIEELRFWSSARSESDIRDFMCKQVPSNYPQFGQLNHYFQFDSGLFTSFPSTGSNTSSKPAQGFSASDIVDSDAPLGEASTWTYPSDWNGKTLSLTKTHTVTVHNVTGDPSGVHIYFLNDPQRSPIPTVNYNGQFGVWGTDTTTGYDIDLDQAATQKVCDSCAFYFHRDSPLDVWKESTDKTTTCSFPILGESKNLHGWREEYLIRDTLEIISGLRDTINVCQGQSISINAAYYQGAQYLWDDGTTSNVRRVSQPGNVWVRIRNKGCYVIDTAYVAINPIPRFTLGPDTTICGGDTVVLRAPIDSVTYLWSTGDTKRQIRVTKSGTYQLTVNRKGCTWTDEINLEIIPKLPSTLGPDSLLCLGQTWSFTIPYGVADSILWSNGSTGRSLRVFNEPGTYWVYAENKCYVLRDTVRLDFYECNCDTRIANSFSPNNDGLNDVFKPVNNCYFEEYELIVWDRWGSEVFHSHDIDNGWDGTLDGKPLPIDTYLYMVRWKKYSWLRSSVFDYGKVNLIR